MSVVSKLLAAVSFVSRINTAIAHAEDPPKIAQVRMSSDYGSKHRAESFRLANLLICHLEA